MYFSSKLEQKCNFVSKRLLSSDSLSLRRHLPCERSDCLPLSSFNVRFQNRQGQGYDSTTQPIHKIFVFNGLGRSTQASAREGG